MGVFAAPGDRMSLVFRLLPFSGLGVDTEIGVDDEASVVGVSTSSLDGGKSVSI